MNAKKLYKKHLKLHTDWHKGVYLAPSQLDRIKYDASLDAIDEAINEVLNMGKIDRKKLKLTNRIKEMEDELRLSLTKKDASTEMNIGKHQSKIQELKVTLSKL